MPLGDSDKSNFNTLLEAAKDGNLALMETTRKSDGKKVALVVAMGFDGTHYLPTPVAVMVEGNPFEDFEPPEGIDS